MSSAPPWYRPRNVLLVLALIGASWLGWQVYLALTATPGRAVDFGARLAQLAESALPPAAAQAENGWDLFLDALDAESVARAELVMARRTGDEPFEIDFSIVPALSIERSGYDRERFGAVRANSIAALEAIRAAGVFEMQARLAAMPRVLRPQVRTVPIILVLLPELGAARNLARLGFARMYLADAAGDDAERAAAFEQTLAMGRIMGGDPFLISGLVAVAIDTGALTELARELAVRPPTPDACRRLLEAMDRQGLPSPALALEAERLSCLDLVQHLHTDDGHGNGRLILSKFGPTFGQVGVGGSLPSARIFNVGGVAFASKAASVAKANEFFDGVRSLLDIPAAGLPDAAFQPDAFTASLSFRFTVLKLVLPSADSVLISAGRLRMMAAGVRIMLALELYRGARGRYPETLDELVPEWLAAPPVDPLSGGPFGYKPLAPGDDPAFGRPYLLYSFGLDGRDDGGRAPTKGPEAAVERHRALGDYVINQPRDPAEAGEPAQPDEPH